MRNAVICDKVHSVGVRCAVLQTYGWDGYCFLILNFESEHYIVCTGCSVCRAVVPNEISFVFERKRDGVFAGLFEKPVKEVIGI